MTIYRFWSGIETIGGNIVEVRTDKARVLADFGLAVSRDTAKKAEDISELEYLLLTNQLPLIPEIFDTTTFKQVVLDAVTEDSIETALFISHLHLDHMGGLQYLPANTTVYLSKESYELFLALVEIEEDITVQCKLIPYEFDEQIRVGDIAVLPKKSDHDTVGSSAFFIEAPDLKLIHSGDFRLTGNHQQFVQKWAEEAKEWQPDVLLIEGTAFSFDSEEKNEESKISRFEADLIVELQSILKEKEIIVLNPYIRNVERLILFSTEIEKQGREFVLEQPYAHVLHAFYPEKSWTVLKETVKQPSVDYIKKTVDLASLKAMPDKYVLQNSFKNLEYLEIFDKGIYLHSNGEPLGDYDPRFEQLQNMLKQRNFDFISFGASGHATKEDLLKIATLINAKLTLPWHTFEPKAYSDALKESGLYTFVPEYGVNYTVD